MTIRQWLAPLAAVTLLLVGAAPAAAHHTFSRTDEILVGQPATALTGGVTELVAPCDPDHRANGIDGHWYHIQGYKDHSFHLAVADTLDADLYFYDVDCRLIHDDSGAQGLVGANETGSIPDDARYAIVDGFAGTGEFTFTIS